MIKHLSYRWPIKRLCSLFQINRSGYYAYLAKGPNRRDMALKLQIKENFILSQGAAGVRTLQHMLAAQHQSVGLYRIRRLMKEMGLKSIQCKKAKPKGSISSPSHLPNVLQRYFNPAEPYHYWCGDITYIKIGQQFCYLAIVVDLFSRRIVAAKMARFADSLLVCQTLNQAICLQKGITPTLFHSDQGPQYTSHRYSELLTTYNIIQSVSRRGNCYDNSPVERVFRSLKCECVPRKGFASFAIAQKQIIPWLMNYYNHIRPHSYNGGLTPSMSEKLFFEAKKMS